MPVAHRRRLRPAGAVAAAVLALAVSAPVVDAAAGARAETTLSATLRDAAGFTQSPEVTLGGWPYLAAANSHHYPTMAIRASDIVVAAGPREPVKANLEVSLTDARFAGSLLTPGPGPITAKFVTANVRFNATNLGRLLGIADFQIMTPDPLGPGDGGPRHAVINSDFGIILSGTVPVSDAPGHTHDVKLSVRARLELDAGRAVIVAEEIYTGDEPVPTATVGTDIPADAVPGVLARFSHRFEPIALPFDVPLVRFTSANTELMLVGRTVDATLDPRHFYPRPTDIG